MTGWSSAVRGNLILVTYRDLLPQRELLERFVRNELESKPLLP